MLGALNICRAAKYVARASALKIHFGRCYGRPHGLSENLQIHDTVADQFDWKLVEASASDNTNKDTSSTWHDFTSM